MLDQNEAPLYLQKVSDGTRFYVGDRVRCTVSLLDDSGGGSDIISFVGFVEELYKQYYEMPLDDGLIGIRTDNGMGGQAHFKFELRFVTHTNDLTTEEQLAAAKGC